MNILKSKLFLVCLLSINLTQTPLQASPTGQAVANITTFSAVIGVIALSNYITTTYLAQEKFLVKADYPHAQEWYNEMAKKHPTAHLNDKLFLQTMRGIPSIYMSWCSTFNQIYFPQEALKDIDNLYRKQTIDGHPLTDKEILTMGMQEFVLLHEAGHIEHNDMTNRLLTLIGCFAAIETARALCSEITNVNNNPKNDIIAIYSELILLNPLLTYFIRKQESNADKFAYTLCDTNALNGGIAFFEDEKIDPLFDIANKQFSPFVETDSSFGSLCQALTMCVDVPCFHIDKTIKQFFASTDITRWVYDYSRDAHHPGPSTRAYAIRKEIEARLQS